ncbi:ATP-binding protein [Phormidium sp. FACHB-592]|uniref:ATP-binding protein n=1 Tax=Stenomitos frigidus AS-A4 TaxID=2933935 RepID=A0ABV0KPI0_9CYAN|nr:ATP-binding protein [Phormidium sp. FACHB-592]MBD2075469.1 ATP-binding protein [Phormidium sp. FACHB-592]
MSQSNLAVQPLEEESHHSKVQSGAAQSDANPSTPKALKLGAQKERSLEQQVEVERICQIDLYVQLERDENLFTALNQWRETGICGCVTTMDRLGLAKSLIFYTQSHIRRRGGLLMTPAPLAYIEIEQNGSPTDLFLLILEFLVNPLDCGYLRQLRSRTWGTLKSCGVKLLIVNNADLLSFNAFNELVRITEKLKISIVLAGSPYLNDVIDPRLDKKKKYITTYNTFLKQHPYVRLSKENIATVIAEWEKKLGWTKPLNLLKDKGIINTLEASSQGQLRVLYENLREVAIWKIDHPKAQINPQNISKALGVCQQPILKL